MIEIVIKSLDNAKNLLMQEYRKEGRWVGELSSSALSTATAVTALTIVDRQTYGKLIQQGLDWLSDNINKDGGWGDTVYSHSNISTTVLVWAAFAPWQSQYTETVKKAETWISGQAGGIDPKSIIKIINKRYGNDRTFAIPILTMCALCGRLGKGKERWRKIFPLPFELAVAPHRLLQWLRLPVVSYALPALIAIGQVRHHFRPAKNPIARILRNLSKEKTLQKLIEIQPSTGGYLEAIPLTSFVLMSLASFVERDHPVHSVIEKGVEFLCGSAREDGSWPIDIDLSTWVTSLSVNALAVNPEFRKTFPHIPKIRQWFLDTQYKEIHPYTQAQPGGWAWTNLAGGVPDADDTPGALMALHNLSEKRDTTIIESAKKGISWLSQLQNSDGGIPTFCRGWGALPFDRSTPDLTAHTIASFCKWYPDMPVVQQKYMDKVLKKCLRYLKKNQSKHGAWDPLWFGNQDAVKEKNLVYGTSRVVIALLDVTSFDVQKMYTKGIDYLCHTQALNGGWGGAENVSPSIEETALAVHALAKFVARHPEKSYQTTLQKGCRWLTEVTQQGQQFPASPIGLYYAKLWYFEKMYPITFTIAAWEQFLLAQRNR